MFENDPRAWSKLDWERLRVALAATPSQVIEDHLDFPIFIIDETAVARAALLQHFADLYISVEMRPNGPCSHSSLSDVLPLVNEIVYSDYGNVMTDWEILAAAVGLQRLTLLHEIPVLRSEIELPALTHLRVVGTNLVNALRAPQLESLEISLDRDVPRRRVSSSKLAYLSIESSGLDSAWHVDSFGSLDACDTVAIVAHGDEVDITGLASAVGLQWLTIHGTRRLTGLASLQALPDLQSVDLTRIREVDQPMALVELPFEVSVQISRPGSWVNDLRPHVAGRDNWFLPKAPHARSRITLADGAQFGVFIAERSEGEEWNFSVERDASARLEDHTEQWLRSQIPDLLESEAVYLDLEGDFINVVARSRQSAVRVAAKLREMDIPD